MFYDRFSALCAERGVSPSRAAIEAGLSKSTVTKWKSNPDSEPTGSAIKKLSDYFGITRAELLGESIEKAPVISDERNEEEIKAAFFNGYSEELSQEEIDSLWDDAKDYFRFKIEQKKKRKD